MLSSSSPVGFGVLNVERETVEVERKWGFKMWGWILTKKVMD